MPNNNAVTQIKTLMENLSFWKWVCPVCFIIVCIVMWIGVGIFLWKTDKLQSEHIRLLIYGFFMTIVFLFLIPLSEKFFAYKLYEEINKQEANRQSAVVQIAKTAIEQLSSKDLSTKDINDLIYTINDCLNNDRDLKERLVTLIDISKECLSESQKDKQVLKDVASKLCDAIKAYLQSPQKENEEKLKNEIADLFKKYLAALKSE